MGISDFATRAIGEKRRWRAYKARTRQLPPNYQTAVEGLERYLMCFGPADGSKAATMFEDLADLFEQAAADGTPVSAVVGADPIEFIETFLRNYSEGGWVNRERDRLLQAIATATKDEGTP